MQRLILSIWILFLVVNLHAQSGTIENISTGITYTTIQSAIDSSQNSDTIVVPNGNWYEDLSFNGKNILLTSNYLFTGDSTDIDSTMLHGSGSGVIVKFTHQENNNARLNGFTLVEGAADTIPYFDSLSATWESIDNAFGVVCIASNPSFSNLKILPAATYVPGDFFSFVYSDVNLNDLRIEGFNNTSMAFIKSVHSDVQISNTAFSGNENNSNNLIRSVRGSIELDSCNYFNNSSDDYAFLLAEQAIVEVANCSFFNSTLDLADLFRLTGTIECTVRNCSFHHIDCIWVGLLISNSGGNINLINNRVFANSNERSSFINLKNCNASINRLLIGNNNLFEEEFVVRFTNCSGILSNASIVNNRSDQANLQAGVGFKNSSMHVVNCIINNNSYTDGFCSITPIESNISADSSNITIDYSVIDGIQQIGSFNQINLGTTVYSDTTAHFSNNPSEFGFSATIDPLDYQLRWYSPAVDHGTATYVVGGDTLIAYSSSDYSGTAPDIGYFEVQPMTGNNLLPGPVQVAEHLNGSHQLMANLSIPVYNNSSIAASGFPVTIHYQNNLFTSVFAGTINPGEVGILQVPVPWPVEKFTSYAGLVSVGNDSIDFYLHSKGRVNLLPYSEDFEDGLHGWLTGGLNSSWAVDTVCYLDPTTFPNVTQDFIDSMHTNHLSTRGSSLCLGNQYSYVESPSFDLSKIIPQNIEFDLFIDAYYSVSALALQYSVDEGVSWQPLGSLGDSVNWYNTNSTLLDTFGLSSGEWNTNQPVFQHCSHALDSLGSEGYLQFRFIYFNDNQEFSQHWIDNIRVDGIYFPEYLSLPNDTIVCESLPIDFVITDPSNILSEFIWEASDTALTYSVVPQQDQWISYHFETIYGHSQSDSFLITFDAVLPDIEGLSSAGINDTIEYSVAPIAGHTYNWALSGGTILSQMGNAIEVLWTGPGEHWIFVQETGLACTAFDSLQVQVVNGIDETSISETQLLIYPNPVKDRLELNFNKQVPVQSIQLCSLRGRIVKKFDPVRGLNQTLNLEGIEPGVYIIRIHSKHADWIRKIVVVF